MKHVPAFTASKYMQQVESILREYDDEEDQEAQSPTIENVYSPPVRLFTQKLSIEQFNTIVELSKID
jgi:hypothetical protein